MLVTGYDNDVHRFITYESHRAIEGVAVEYDFNTTIRQWGREVVLPIPKADLDKLNVLLDKVVGERVRVRITKV
jgi:hypothetical protein